VEQERNDLDENVSPGLQYVGSNTRDSREERRGGKPKHILPAQNLPAEPPQASAGEIREATRPFPNGEIRAVVPAVRALLPEFEDHDEEEIHAKPVRA
jgi:hypothetical protein